jgi:hypothetical protein
LGSKSSSFQPFNRFAPFKPFKAGIESRILTKLCLKFARDRRRYLHWLFEAKNRFGLSVLDYIVTSNHIHLSIQDTGSTIIAQSMSWYSESFSGQRDDRLPANSGSPRMARKSDCVIAGLL